MNIIKPSTMPVAVECYNNTLLKGILARLQVSLNKNSDKYPNGDCLTPRQAIKYSYQGFNRLHNHATINNNLRWKPERFN